MDLEAARTSVERFFTDLDAGVFAGDPAANRSLRVEVVASEHVADGVVVAVVAPWTIAFVLFYEDPFPDELVLGGRRVPVLVNEAPGLGRYRSVTPIRGIETFETQEAAVTAAGTAMGSLCDAIVAVRDEARVEDPSRRSFFRSLSGGGEPAGSGG